MSFNLIAIIFGVLLLVIPFFCILCFVWGIRYGQRGQTPNIEVKTLAEKKQEKERKKQSTKEQANLNKLLRNIEHYDGTGINQEKFE